MHNIMNKTIFRYLKSNIWYYLKVNVKCNTLNNNIGHKMSFVALKFYDFLISLLFLDTFLSALCLESWIINGKIIVWNFKNVSCEFCIIYSWISWMFYCFASSRQKFASLKQKFASFCSNFRPNLQSKNPKTSNFAMRI